MKWLTLNKQININNQFRNKCQLQHSNAADGVIPSSMHMVLILNLDTVCVEFPCNYVGFYLWFPPTAQVFKIG